jgi:hypothetical protein
MTGARAVAWCHLVQANASLSLSTAFNTQLPKNNQLSLNQLPIQHDTSTAQKHGVQGESLVPPNARGSVSLSTAPEQITRLITDLMMPH